MDHYAGIDVSLELSSICIVKEHGAVAREGKVASEPEALAAFFQAFGKPLARIGLEAGPLSQWLYEGLRKAGFVVELLETRRVHAAFQAAPIKTDRNDARGIASLMRLGWFRPVHCKSLPAQETRALLSARKLVQNKMHDVEMSLRGILRGFGLKVGEVKPRLFAVRIGELVADHPVLQEIAHALLKVREVLMQQFQAFEKRVRALARGHKTARLLMSAPGVGVVVAMTYVAALDDPGRFKHSKDVGPNFGLTPRKYQSGETDYTGHIQQMRRCFGACRII